MRLRRDCDGVRPAGARGGVAGPAAGGPAGRQANWALEMDETSFVTRPPRDGFRASSESRRSEACPRRAPFRRVRETRHKAGFAHDFRVTKPDPSISGVVFGDTRFRGVQREAFRPCDRATKPVSSAGRGATARRLRRPARCARRALCPRSCPRPPGFSLRRCAPDADAHFPASPRSSWSRRGARSRFPSDRGTKMQFSNVWASSLGRFRSSARPLLVAGEKFNGEAAGQGGASSRGVGAVPGGPCGELHFCAAIREKMRSVAPAPRARAAGARAAGDVSPMRPFVVGIRDESRRKPLPPASMPTSPAWGGRRR